MTMLFLARFRSITQRWALAAGFLLCVAPVFGLADDQEKPDVLRVCQDPNNLPFSNTKGEGYENKIAELFAKQLGVPLEYYSFPNRLGFIRNTLRYKLPGESNYRCDLVVGVPEGYDQVAATKPYYHSTYALVYVEGHGLDSVHSAQDLLALDPQKLQSLKIGIFDRSPASEWLSVHKLLPQAVPYRLMNADPDFYPGEIVEKDLAQGKIDAAILWGPIAGYFAKRVQTPRLVVVPLKSEPGVKFDYRMAMGVRFGEPQWKAVIERLIAENEPRILAVLRDYGVPLVDDQGEPIR
jgi:quinoprotein dehydrogenase-associated probable ABC transporter substrate-binding protein